MVSHPSVGSAGLWLLAFTPGLGFGPDIAGRIISVAFVGPGHWPPFASGVAVVTGIRRVGRHGDHLVAHLGSSPDFNAVSSSSWLVDGLDPYHLI